MVISTHKPPRYSSLLLLLFPPSSQPVSLLFSCLFLFCPLSENSRFPYNESMLTSYKHNGCRRNSGLERLLSMCVVLDATPSPLNSNDPELEIIKTRFNASDNFRQLNFRSNHSSDYKSIICHQ